MSKKSMGDIENMQISKFIKICFSLHTINNRKSKVLFTCMGVPGDMDVVGQTWPVGQYSFDRRVNVCRTL